MSGDTLPRVRRSRYGGRTDIRCPKTLGARDPKPVPIVRHTFEQQLEQ